MFTILLIMILICTSICIDIIYDKLSIHMYICVCNAITENQIQQAIAEGADSVAQLKERLEVAGNCGMCIESVMECLQMAAVPQQA